MRKILIIANHYNTLRVFRKELITQLIKEGNEVIVAFPPCKPQYAELIQSWGCTLLFVDMERRGMNPFKDLMLCYRYVRLLGRIRPDQVITYTIKPNIYGGIACQIRHIPYCANITGLGSAYQSEKRMMTYMLDFLYRISLRQAKVIFFENEGDQQTLVQRHVMDARQTTIMPGAGVNVSDYALQPFPDSKEEIRFLYIGRMMKEKGVDELFEAIGVIKQRYPNVLFTLIGWDEENYKDKLDSLIQQGLIRYDGFQTDVKAYIKQSHCIILPSWHEGMSNTLLESGACGRALIASNVHGCKEAVIDGKSGYLFKVKNVSGLIACIERFIHLPHSEKQAMGLCARKHIQDHFDKAMVVDKTIAMLENE